MCLIRAQTTRRLDGARGSAWRKVRRDVRSLQFWRCLMGNAHSRAAMERSRPDSTAWYCRVSRPQVAVAFRRAPRVSAGLHFAHRRLLAPSSATTTENAWSGLKTHFHVSGGWGAWSCWLFLGVTFTTAFKVPETDWQNNWQLVFCNEFVFVSVGLVKLSGREQYFKVVYFLHSSLAAVQALMTVSEDSAGKRERVSTHAAPISKILRTTSNDVWINLKLDNDPNNFFFI